MSAYSPPKQAGDEMSEWLPIESAPKDGYPVQLWRPQPQNGRWQSRITALWYSDNFVEAWIWPDSDWINIEDDDRSWIRSGDFYEDKSSFTHWMPLPAPPKQAGKETR